MIFSCNLEEISTRKIFQRHEHEHVGRVHFVVFEKLTSAYLFSQSETICNLHLVKFKVGID